MPNDEKLTGDSLVAHIVANPKDYGFDWYLDNVDKNGMSMGQVPLVKHLDVALMTTTFGDRFFLDSADGTSRHVTNQRIGRDSRWDNRKITVDEIKTLIVQNMLGQKSRRSRVTVVEKIVNVKTYEAMDGKEYATQLEMQQANLAWFAEQKINS